MLISRMDLKDVGGGDGGETPRGLMDTIIRNEAYYCFFGQRHRDSPRSLHSDEARISDPNQRHHVKWGHELS